MKSGGKVQVVVRSRRVPVGTFVHTDPVYSTSGFLVGYVPSVRVLYGTAYDSDHQRTIDEAQKLAENLGLGLEVVDRSRSGVLARLLSRLGRAGSGSPAVVVPSTGVAPTSDPPPAMNHGC